MFLLCSLEIIFSWFFYEPNLVKCALKMLPFDINMISLVTKESVLIFSHLLSMAEIEPWSVRVNPKLLLFTQANDRMWYAYLLR